MRDLKDFTTAKWIRRLPLRYGFKQARNNVITLMGAPPEHGG